MPSLTLVQAFHLDSSLDNEFFLSIERHVKNNDVTVTTEGGVYTMQISPRLCVHSKPIDDKLLITINAVNAEDPLFDYMTFAVELSRVYRVLRILAARRKENFEISVKQLIQSSDDGQEVYVARNIGDYLAVLGLLDEDDHSGCVPSGFGKVFPELVIIDRSGLVENIYTYSFEALTATEPLVVGEMHKKEIFVRAVFIDTEDEEHIIKRLLSNIEQNHRGQFTISKIVHSETGRTYVLGTVILDLLDLPDGKTKFHITVDAKNNRVEWKTGKQLKCVYDALHGFSKKGEISRLATTEEAGFHDCYRVNSPAQFLDLCARVEEISAESLSKTRFPCFVTVMEIHGGRDATIVSV